MEDLIFHVCEYGVMLVPGLLCLWAVRRRRHSRGTLAWQLLLLLYGAMVLDVTGSGMLADLLRSGGRLDWQSLHWLPFSEPIDPVGYGLNVLLCMPWGFLAARLDRRFHGLAMAALGGFGLSLAIELSQLCNFRSTDVDDLIINTMGAVLGYFCYRCWQKMTHTQPATDGCPAALMAALFVGRFLLWNGVAAAARIYGF